MWEDELLKYVRTPHLQGSRLQINDSTDDQVSVASLIAGEKVWEEKIDGSNVGISFSLEGDLRLQSRGHYLTGGWREKQYNLFKRWTSRHVDWFFDVLSNRYVMYGEWCFAKHTVFYDALPHYFLEFDIFDRSENCFLSTDRRHSLLRGGPVVSVPVIHVGGLTDTKDVCRFIRPSLYKTNRWREEMAEIARQHGIDPQQAERETDPSSLSEGLYLKVEQDGRVTGRFKFVRPDFVQTILESGSHWNTRTILPNQLATGVDIFN